MIEADAADFAMERSAVTGGQVKVMIAAEELFAALES
jgi:hypothetical protein